MYMCTSHGLHNTFRLDAPISLPIIFFLPWLLFNYRVKYELCIEPFVKMKNLLVLIQSKYYYYNLVHYTANVFNMFRVLYLHIILCVRFIYRFLGSDLLTKRIKRL